MNDACSTDTRARHIGRQHALAIRLGLLLEQLPRRHADHARLMPSAVSFSYASTHSATSLPVAIRMISGLPPFASAST